MNGTRVTLAGERGRYVLVTFIYTHCPDVCPLITQNLNAALRVIGPSARQKVRVLAVSVDPVGDTPRAVRAYIREKHLFPQFQYLIGSRAELRRVWKAWHVLAVQSSPTSSTTSPTRRSSTRTEKNECCTTPQSTPRRSCTTCGS